MNGITVDRVLQVSRDFDGHGGASLALVAWELSVEPDEVSGSWAGAIDAGLLDAAEPQLAPSLELDVESLVDEEMWRLTAAGWDRLGVDPETDRHRAATIAELGILERISHPALNALTRVTMYLMGVDGAAVHIFDDRYQHRIAAVNAPLDQHPAHDTLCRLVVDSGEAIVTPDASADPRFDYSTFTRGPDPVRFFAAMPLRLGLDGAVVGTLCAFGSRVREITEEQRRILDDLAEIAIAQLECTRMAIDRFEPAVSGPAPELA